MRGGGGFYNFYYKNEVYLYTFPLIIGVIYIVKSYYFPKVFTPKGKSNKKFKDSFYKKWDDNYRLRKLDEDFMNSKEN